MKKAPQTFSHLDKVFWPREKYTKGDLIAYYRKVSKFILPYLKERPSVLNRFPDGIRGIHFFQKNVAGQKVPRFVKTITIRAKTTGKPVRYIVCNNEQTLLYLANLGCIEVHPWNSRVGKLGKPDYMILDLDPGARVPFNAVVKVAQETHALLNALGVPNFCKTSGKKGLHVYVPLKAQYPYDRVREFADRIARAVHERAPDLTSLAHWPAKRKNKIHIDIMRNAIGQTAAAPYSLRPVPGASVSTPLRWSEVRAGLRPEMFTIKTIFPRLQKKGDLWKPVLGRGVDLERAARKLRS